MNRSIHIAHSPCTPQTGSIPATMVSVLGSYDAWVDLRFNYMTCCGLDFVSTAGYATAGYVYEHVRGDLDDLPYITLIVSHSYVTVLFTRTGTRATTCLPLGCLRAWPSPPTCAQSGAMHTAPTSLISSISGILPIRASAVPSYAWPRILMSLSFCSTGTLIRSTACSKAASACRYASFESIGGALLCPSCIDGKDLMY